MYFCFLFLSAYAMQLVTGDRDCKDHKYVAMVYTGDAPDAGTDAKVLITLVGERGYCRWNNLSNLKKGHTDYFYSLVCPCLGQLRKLRIGHDNSGNSPGWYLEKVVIQNVVSGQTVTFKAERWLSKDKGDGKIAVELTAKESDCKWDRKGIDYSGTKDTTADGELCQEWKSNNPNVHHWNNLENNYCRNPNGDPKGPWCYYKSFKGRGHCNIPLC